MTPNKHLEVIERYRNFFVRNGVEVIEHSHKSLCAGAEAALAHCHAMLDKMINFVREGREGKVNRWLGFVQGCLWICGKHTLDELMNHSRPADTPFGYQILSGDVYYSSSALRAAPFVIIGAILGFVAGRFI